MLLIYAIVVDGPQEEIGEELGAVTPAYNPRYLGGRDKWMVVSSWPGIKQETLYEK
jgi:hypothetical protein